MKVLIYCQYLLGMGHLFRSARIASGLAGHEVVLLAGGPAVSIQLPDHVRLVRQRGLRSTASFDALLPCEPGDDLETVKAERSAQLLEIMESFRPDVLLIEQYPFGRGMFRFELEPCLEGIRAGRFGRVKVACSVRDVLSVRRDPGKWEAKVKRRMGQDFDAVLVHGDPALLPMDRTFSSLDQLDAPIHYTGYVAPENENVPRSVLRKRLGLDGDARIVVAGFGAGRVGANIAECLVDAFAQDELPGMTLLLFAGPLAGAAHLEALRTRAKGLPRVKIELFSPHFVSYVFAADCVVAMGGYNTCMDILSAGVPALLCPLEGEPEQSLRCSTFEQHGLCDVLHPEQYYPGELAQCLMRKINNPKVLQSRFIPDLDGVRKTVRLLEQIVSGDHP